MEELRIFLDLVEELGDPFSVFDDGTSGRHSLEPVRPSEAVAEALRWSPGGAEQTVPRRNYGG
jgi:hypothetical protein